MKKRRYAPWILQRYGQRYFLRYVPLLVKLFFDLFSGILDVCGSLRQKSPLLASGKENEEGALVMGP